ncbi:MAG: ATP-binding protein [Bacteroidetes bacterium]|nr:ATP-binding protein [Bacteroidota bacterium]
MAEIERLLKLPSKGVETFFLWGARQSGKSTLLRRNYPEVRWLDLLQAETFRRYSTNPELLRQELEQSGEKFVVIDEIQKVPALLDEVHWLHENRGVHFALCGSSARKLKRGHGNLLGGRGARFELFGLSAMELGDSFDLDRMLNQGTIPRIYLSENPRRLLNAYVAEYLAEEVMAEGLVRQLPPFSNFLNAAALSDTEQVNYTNIARELGVSRETVRGYFEILEDTLIGYLLPSYRKRPKRRVVAADKFYFSDVGVANFLAKRGQVIQGGELYGKAFENWVLHELRCYDSYRERYANFSYWRLSSGIEVDFIINELECAIECKSTSLVQEKHLKGLRELGKEHSGVKRRILLAQEVHPRKTPDGIEILNITLFLQELWAGKLF